MKFETHDFGWIKRGSVWKMNQYQNLRSIVIIFLLIPVWFLVSWTPLQAQDTAYRIGPRDVLTLTIFAGGEKQNVSSMTVSSQGMVNVPFIGSVMAKGLTISQLEDSVTKPLATDYFVNPEVNIVISEYHSLHYFISGAVGSPGLYEMKSRATLLELIAKAGGVSADHGNIAYILHPSSDQTASKKANKNLYSDNDPLKIDLNKLLDKGDMNQNVELQSGDVIYIPLSIVTEFIRIKNLCGRRSEKPGSLYLSGGADCSECVHHGRRIQ